MSNTTTTIQQQFTNAILMAMDKMKENGLKRLGERATVKGADSHTFNRKKKASYKKVVKSMFGDNGAKGDGGDFAHFKASPERIISQEKFSKDEMNKTKIDLKSSFVSAMTTAVAVGEDEIIIDKIKTGATALTGGVATKTIDDLVNVKELIKAVRRAHVWSKTVPDAHKGVGVVIHPDDYITLSTSEIFINGDYQAAFRGGTGDVPVTFYGAEIFISDLVDKGTTYVVPAYSFGYAEWEGSLETTAEYHATDGLSWHLQITKTGGAVLIEADKIAKISSKAA